eukprot:5400491-Pyramimonas_sp.AAC.1
MPWTQLWHSSSGHKPPSHILATSVSDHRSVESAAEKCPVHAAQGTTLLRFATLGCIPKAGSLIMSTASTRRQLRQEK